MNPEMIKSSLYRIAHGIAAWCAATALLTSCEKAPDNVLGREEMASLMADIHMGEAVIDYNYSAFPNDSTRKLLKQSIYAAHGVDAATVDTSFVWYGNHIEDYIKVYDRAIEIIQDRQRDLASETSSQIAIAGDSVAIWNGPGHITLSERMPSRVVTFAFTPDSTWQNGDIFMLRYVPVVSNAPVTSRLLVDYDNGATGYVDETSMQSGAMVQRIQVDSTLTPVRVYGYMTMPSGQNITGEIDSIAVVRMRHYMMPNTYISQRRFNNGIKIEQSGVRGIQSRENMLTESGPGAMPAEGRTPVRQRTEPKHLQRATQHAGDLPQSSSERTQHTEHRQSADEHRATPESRRRQAAERRRQATPTQHQRLQKRQDSR